MRWLILASAFLGAVSGAALVAITATIWPQVVVPSDELAAKWCVAAGTIALISVLLIFVAA